MQHMCLANLAVRASHVRASGWAVLAATPCNCTRCFGMQHCVAQEPAVCLLLGAWGHIFAQLTAQSLISCSDSYPEACCLPFGGSMGSHFA